MVAASAIGRSWRGISFMGEGFIRKAAESFRKKRDRDRMALIERDLLAVDPECGQTTGLARLHPGERVGAGDEVALEMDGERLSVYRCNREIGVFPNPTPELLNIVKSLFGAAPAIVVRVHPISGTADIAVGCP